MQQHHLLLLLAVAASTTAIAVALGRRRGVSRLGASTVVAIEIVGATTLFFTANLAIGVTVVLAIRRLTSYSTTLYDVTDASLLIFSLLQALVFETWRRSR